MQSLGQNDVGRDRPKQSLIWLSSLVKYKLAQYHTLRTKTPCVYITVHDCWRLVSILKWFSQIILCERQTDYANLGFMNETTRQHSAQCLPWGHRPGVLKSGTLIQCFLSSPIFLLLGHRTRPAMANIWHTYSPLFFPTSRTNITSWPWPCWNWPRCLNIVPQAAIISKNKAIKMTMPSSSQQK